MVAEAERPRRGRRRRVVDEEDSGRGEEEHGVTRVLLPVRLLAVDDEEDVQAVLLQLLPRPEKLHSLLATVAWLCSLPVWFREEEGEQGEREKEDGGAERGENPRVRVRGW